MEVEAVDEGTLGKILVPEGTNDVAVNTPIAMILAEGEDQAALKDGTPQQASADATQPARQQKAAESAPPAEKDEPAKKAEAPAPAKTGTATPPPAQAHARARSAGRHRDGHHDHARGVARRHGRGNAPRCRRVRDRRGSRRISGRLQGDAGPAAGIRRAARHRYADHRAWLCRSRRRRRVRRAKADRRVHDLQFRHAGDGPSHQLGGEDALHVRRPGRRVDRLSRAERRRPPASPPSTARIIRPGIRMSPG